MATFIIKNLLCLLHDTDSFYLLETILNMFQIGVLMILKIKTLYQYQSVFSYL